MSRGTYKRVLWGMVGAARPAGVSELVIAGMPCGAEAEKAEGRAKIKNSKNLLSLERRRKYTLKRKNR